MLHDHAETCGCSHVRNARRPSAVKPDPLLSEVAHRLLARLTVADMLTETPDLTEVDVIALDVLLAAGLDDARELIQRIEQLPDAGWSTEATPHA